VGKTKFTLYEMLVRSISNNEREIWALKSKDETMSRIFGRRILRRIYSPIKGKGIWKSWYNQQWPAYQMDSVSPHQKRSYDYELYKLLNEADITKAVEGER
jgi:hypothetical protein